MVAGFCCPPCYLPRPAHAAPSGSSARMRLDRRLRTSWTSLLRGIVAAIWVAASLCFNALADEAPPLRGVALVLGKSDYEHLPKLPNPVNDARKIEELLSALGFKTDIATNRTTEKLKRELQNFAEDADGADVALGLLLGPRDRGRRRKLPRTRRCRFRVSGERRRQSSQAFRNCWRPSGRRRRLSSCSWTPAEQVRFRRGRG